MRLRDRSCQNVVNAADTANLPADTSSLIAALKCNATYQTWTDTTGSNDNLPINCVSWYLAMAFCIWDGGYLPTEAEWMYAAGGGLEQRAYPWSSPASSTAFDCTYANLDCGSSTIAAARVGSRSPKGDGRWGNADLAGNVSEWNLDLFTQTYSNPCNDCAALGDAAANHVNHDGAFSINSSFAAYFRVCNRTSTPPGTKSQIVGFRCARSP
jgi:formylglycine-generating enzyme required for sulfatase activity